VLKSGTDSSLLGDLITRFNNFIPAQFIKRRSWCLIQQLFKETKLAHYKKTSIKI
jgi:hypothetical protein